MTKKKILIIDDEVNLANLIRDILEDDSFEVAAAHNGKDGMEKVKSWNPDLLILDVELPDTNGYEICRTLRENLGTRNLPIIMLTVKGSVADELTGLSLGADDYLTKPFKPTLLRARINMAIARNIRELDANPLTRLPGNVTIIKELEKRIRGKDPFVVLYLDLNNFKAYNDHYGFVRGDEVIKVTSQIILQVLNETHEEHDFFMGHIGGDDFMAVVRPEDLDRICELIIRRFDSFVHKFYDAKDQKQGHITLRDRRGMIVHYKFIGIAIAAVTAAPNTYKHPAEISAVASDLKKLAKSEPRSAYVMDRRRKE